MPKDPEEDRLFDTLEALLEEDTRRHPAQGRYARSDIPMLVAMFLISVLVGAIIAQIGGA